MKPVEPQLPTLAAVVRAELDISWNAARKLCKTGRVKVAEKVQTDASTRVNAEDVTVNPTGRKLSSGRLEDSRILHVDGQIVVVFKNAGELTIPYENERDTLVDKLGVALRRRNKKYDPPLNIVHRLDKGTSGVLVFARTLKAKRHLANLFRNHDIERRYEALAHGQVAVRSFESHLIPNRGDGLRGSWGQFRKPQGPLPKEARWSKTHARQVRLLLGASHVSLELETGRQHQIRIHLAEAGHPIVGERVYIRDHTRAGRPVIEAPRPMLHARSLGFEHPQDGRLMQFEVPAPEDFQTALRRLG